MTNQDTRVALPVFDREEHTKHPPRMSFEEFVRWVPDGVQAEWVEGEVIVLTNTTRHGRISGLLFAFLRAYVRLLGIGEVFLPPFLMRARPGGSGREPDIVVILADHRDRIGRVGMEGPADFVVEVLSEETARTDLVRKREEYAAAGVPEYLILEGREGREGFWYYRLGTDGRYESVEADSEGRHHSTVLPGLWLDPRWFSRDPLPEVEELLYATAPEIYGDAYAAWNEAKRRGRARLLGEA